MKFIIVYLLAFIGGVFLAIQAGFNTQLSVLLKQPILAVISTSITSAVLGCVLILIFGKENIQPNTFGQVPWYLWFVGGLFSVIGISLYFYTIPKLGISKMIALGLCGQLAFSLIAGKFGWLNLPIEPITTKRVLGILAMIIGIFLINTK
ncbi:DMT family transporter [Flavobacterium sediminilitoris]|uniref:DMT family transporter n=1 Tax=Flavobacterium sediminilitoris TaxID=2024526 RepID=A0ABY4HRT9_9FLAO|nr:MULTISPECIES: DMT family transporter [Flavobacterium]UOX34224.1 DMT family transporter [Flavobacterium sediminilitoris]